MAKAGRKTLGNYAVEKEIGRGGMGVVYLGRQNGLERAAVLKKLRDDLASGPEFLERFRREAHAAGEVHHQNVVAVYDCFTYRGDQYIAQEYVDGIDLRGVLEKVQRVPPEIAGRIALEIIRGLEAIHSSGTVHRDLKPANILLGRSGEVKIADFGIALDPTGPKLTQPGIMIGTPPYMLPEQMLGARVDHRGDLFSFGILCYEMVAGETPYPGPQDDEAETLLARMEKERYRPLRKRVPAAARHFSRLVRSCLRPRANQRGGSAAAVRRKLERKILYPSSADCQGRDRSMVVARRRPGGADGFRRIHRGLPGSIAPARLGVPGRRGGSGSRPRSRHRSRRPRHPPRRPPLVPAHPLPTPPRLPRPPSLHPVRVLRVPKFGISPKRR